jgi:hypothetical protein
LNPKRRAFPRLDASHRKTERRGPFLTASAHPGKAGSAPRRSLRLEPRIVAAAAAMGQSVRALYELIEKTTKAPLLGEPQ